MNTLRRFLALFLCFAMMLSVMACGKASDGDTQTTKDYVYVAEYKGLNGLEYLSNSMIQGNQMYYQVWVYDETTQIGENVLYVMDLTTLESTEIPLRKDASENLYNMTVDADGGLVMLMAKWDETGSSPTAQYFLVKVDQNGQETLRKDLTSILMEGVDPEFGIYPQAMEVDGEGNIYLLLNGMSEKSIVLDEQGQKLFELADSNWHNGMVQSSDGRIFLYGYDHTSGNGGLALTEIKVKDKAFGETLQGIPEGNGSMLCTPNGENTLLISSGNKLYQYDMTTQTAEEVLNWIDCDINSDGIQQLTMTEDGRILIFLYDYSSDSAYTEAVYLKKTPASEVAQKTTLTYGTLYLDQDVRNQIIAFNKTNAKYRIEVEEYGQGDEGITLLNAAITSGNPPDIIDLSYGDVDTYISKEVLTDLYPLMDGDSSMKREDFIPNILKMYEQDEKLYGVAMNFSISSLMGKTADVGTEPGWTVADVQKLLASKPEGTMLLEYASRETMLMVLTIMGADSYIDWVNGTCSFDSQEFIDVLEFAADFPSEDEMVYSGEGTYTMISQGKLLLTEVNASSVGDYLATAAMFGEPVTCIGYPTPDGTGGSVVSPNMSFGIAEKSKNKEAAWEFISGMMAYEFQTRSSWNFPIRQDVLEEQFEEAMNDQGGGSWMWDDFSYEVQPATEEEIAAVRRLIESAEGTISYNEDIYSIIMEEAAPFFEGKKTAQEVADIIQSRAKIYVSENN